jgi:hypothetical protein
MKNTMMMFTMLSAVGYGQITLPEGTKVRLRLEQAVSSATAQQGHEVEFSVAEDVNLGDITVIPQGARAVGSILEAQPSRRMGRAGKLEFSIERVRSVDGKYIPLRYTQTSFKGKGRGVTTGAVTAGIAIAFLPAAPIALLIKGKDVNVPRGSTYTVFTDAPLSVKTPAAKADPVSGSPAAAPVTYAPSEAPASMLNAVQYTPIASRPSATPATLTITSPQPGAEIEINGAFVGSTPTVLNVPAGMHRIVVRNGAAVWQRDLQVSAASNIAVHASFNSVAIPGRTGNALRVSAVED